jgi:hypothetical protein
MGMCQWAHGMIYQLVAAVTTDMNNELPKPSIHLVNNTRLESQKILEQNMVITDVYPLYEP